MSIVTWTQVQRVGPAVLLCAVLVWLLPAGRAQQEQIVDGLVVNIGVVKAGQAVRFPEEPASHPQLGKKGGDHHLVVSLIDTHGSTHVADADVHADVQSPDGKLQAKRLVPSLINGQPDYSEVFDMHVPGRYQITVYVWTRESGKPLTTRFAWTNSD